MEKSVELRAPSNHVRIWNICATIVVLGLALSGVIQDSLNRSKEYHVAPGIPYDFPHYYVAGRLARLGPPGNLLYYPPTDHIPRSWMELRTDATTPYGRPSSETGLPDRFVTMPFDAPPFSALVMEPLAFLPWQAAYFVWQLLDFCMMMGALYLALRLSRNRPPPTLVMTVVFALAFLILPFKWALSVGNIDVLLLFLWALGAFLLSRGRLLPSAICFALGTAIKVSPVFAVPLLAMRRQWRWLASYGIASLALLAFSTWRLGWTNHIVWARQVAPALSVVFSSYNNWSLPSFVLTLLPQGLLTTLVGPHPGWFLFLLGKAVSVSCYSVFLIWCWRKTRDSQGLLLEVVILPLVVLLASPLCWPQYYVLAVLPLAYLWARSRDQAVRVSKPDMILLTFSTLVFGMSLPVYRFAGPSRQPIDSLVMGGWVTATMAIIWVGMRMYGSCLADGPRAAGLDASRAPATAPSIAPTY